MSQLPDLLDLSITLIQPPAGSPPEVLANLTLHCDPLGLTYTGGVLTDPLTDQERQELHWYLEEYWKWPYEQFRERGEHIEHLLPILGRRLYKAVFGSIEVRDVLQAWRLQPGAQRQISIVSSIPRVLSLPWELLHDEQGFLVLRARQPVSLVRHLLQRELPALSTPFEPPLRILLATAQPEGIGFIDPRSSARELVNAMQEQMDIGAITVEFLRPPTLPALRERLKDTTHPVHLLHFDGHGIFGPTSLPQDGLRKSDGAQGKLAFEDTDGRLALVEASVLAQVLQDSGVRLVVLDACQSAMGSDDDAFSSVAARLIQGGVDAVIAMSSSVLVASSTRYVEAFYRELAKGTAVQVAQERARQALHDDPRRHLSRRRRDEEGASVELRDWWLSHYYQQRPLVLQPTRPARKRKQAKAVTVLPRLSEQMPAEPRYGFTGRAYELLQIERALLYGKLVVIHGFGGIGKTTLSRETADWLTRTRMYDGACFVFFEQGSDATKLLSALGMYLGAYDGSYNPNDTKEALARLKPVLKKKRTLVITDNLESILPNGESPLEAATRSDLWTVLLELRNMGAGMLLTSRDTSFGDGRLAPGKQVMHLPLGSLHPEDAYILASRLLNDLGIDRARAPYGELHGLLARLDYLPLAIQLVLPALCDRSLASIYTDFTQLLPTFVDDTTTGCNRSLLASLDYSLRRLSEKQRALLSRLNVFEGGANEGALLYITEIPQNMWATLRPALEQAALLTTEQIHEAIGTPFLHFHPVLVPFLRRQAGADEDAELRQRYVGWYYSLAKHCNNLDYQQPQPVRAMVRRELPNLRHALELLYKGEVEAASYMADYLARFLTFFGLIRERDQLRHWVENAVVPACVSPDGALTHAGYLHELGRAQDERGGGNLNAAYMRLVALLRRIQAQHEEADLGPGSHAHSSTLQELSRCLMAAGQLVAAEQQFHETLSLLDALLMQEPNERRLLIQHANVLHDLAMVLREQGKYTQAQERYEQALQEHRTNQDISNEATTLLELGTLAAMQRNYAQARSRFLQALDQFRALGQLREQAISWHNLGNIALDQKEWAEAERCYRESLALKEQLGDIMGTARTCNGLANLAGEAGRPGEAEGWYQGALERVTRVERNGREHAVFLDNLASLLVSEVKAGRVARTRLGEARHYAEQARDIQKQPGISAEIWDTFNTLAKIAELEEQPEKAQDYRCQERESFATFVGNRYHIDQEHMPLIAAIAVATQGDAQMRVQVEAALPQWENQGWQISTAVQQIWKGERDWHALAEGMDRNSALLILRVLEILAQFAEAQGKAQDSNLD